MVLVVGEVVAEFDIVGEDGGVMSIESDFFDISAVVGVGGVVGEIVRRGLETWRGRGGARDKGWGWFGIWCAQVVVDFLIGGSRHNFDTEVFWVGVFGLWGILKPF
jgi:hypothetical protein